MQTVPPVGVYAIYKNLLVQIFASLGYPVFENPKLPGKFLLNHVPLSTVRKAILIYKREEKEISKTFVQNYLAHLKYSRLTPGASCEAMQPDNDVCGKCTNKCQRYIA